MAEMDEQRQVPAGTQPPYQNPDWDLAFCYFGSIATGAISPVIVALFTGWWAYVSGFSIVCGVVGFVWGVPTVIVAAAASCEHRRAATLVMFAILMVLMLGFSWMLMGASGA